LIIDLNGPLSDPFFGAVKQGADAAAGALGIDYQYSATANETNFVPDYSTLIRQAIGRHPSALVIGNFVPSAFDPLIKQAVAAGIPVVVMNTGLESWQADGAIAFVGAPPGSLGEAHGAGAVKAGVRHLLCVNHAPVNPALGQECQGAGAKLAASGGTMTELDIPTADNANPSAVTEDIHGFLASHSDIDGVMTLGSAISTDAIAAVKAAGRFGKVVIGTGDVSTADLQAVKSGDLGWVIDQQGYLQGFDSLQIAAQYVRYKIYPTQTIMTGGVVIDKDNVDAVLAVQTAHPGLRGAA
jgi:simple sugar transport system substrate-binding protein